MEPERKNKVPRSVVSKRERFFATVNEQRVIGWLREFGWNPIVTDSISKSIYSQLEMLDRKKEFMIQEGQQGLKEFEDIAVGLGQLEVFYFRWLEYMKELKNQ